MKTQQIKSSISTSELKFKPGGEPVFFQVTVTNLSDRFASFQLEIIAPGADEKSELRWYSLSQEISSKKPPGDRTEFQVAIIDSPVLGFVGSMNLTVRIFSVELGQEERDILRLLVEPSTKIIPVKLHLPVQKFQAYPENVIDIPVGIENVSQQPTTVTLSLLGLTPYWLPQGTQRQLQIKPKNTLETSFTCQIPMTTQVVAKSYPFVIEVTQEQGISSQVTGVLDIIASGFINFLCIPLEQKLPDQGIRRIRWWKNNSATYNINFENHSNVPQTFSIDIQSDHLKKCYVQVIPEELETNIGEKNKLQLLIKKSRPWFGLSQKLLFQIKAKKLDDGLSVKNDTQLLKLYVLPLFPLWLQLLGGLGLLYLFWAISWLNPNNPYYGHQRSVNSVQFNGIGDKLVTVSDDDQIIKWDTNGFFNPLINQEEAVLGQTDKAGRVLRFNPFSRVIAIGLENGETQIWPVAGKNSKYLNSFAYKKDDRIFSIKYASDGRYVFTGHGSGLVLAWNVDLDIANNPTNQPFLRTKHQFDFAISTISLVGKDDIYLVIGGRYNQLALWKWASDQAKQVKYPVPGSQEDYINTISVANYNSNIMVSGDSQGYITMWNMQKCLEENQACEILDRWENGHGGKAVRSVSLTPDGCYLASGGDDGRLMFWSLDL